ncbi:MAG: hypothetical protein CR966_01085 [Pseudomonadales bacterium]|nr:MAG: hypothetical protein CR966_01085 [Pseudomonadales bacterium]
MRTATISIDPNALNHNIEQVAKLCSQAHTRLQNSHPQNQGKPANIMVMLKANAYGHGLDVCTLALLHNGNLTNNQNCGNHGRGDTGQNAWLGKNHCAN